MPYGWVAGGLAAGALLTADSPDYSGVNQAAVDNAKVAKEALDFNKAEMARTQDMRDTAMRTSNEVAGAQLENLKTGTQQAADAYGYQTGTFRPVEKQLVTMAQQFDTPERREAEAAQAGADAQMAGSQNRTATMRELARRNGSISGGRALALQDTQDIRGALAQATAQNTARRSIEQQGWARMSDVANLGRNIASGQATTQGVANQSGVGAVQAATATTNQALSGMGAMNQGYQTAITGNQSAGNLYGQVASGQAAEQAATMQAVGSMAGAGMTAYAINNYGKK